MSIAQARLLAQALWSNETLVINRQLIAAGGTHLGWSQEEHDGKNAISIFATGPDRATSELQASEAVDLFTRLLDRRGIGYSRISDVCEPLLLWSKTIIKAWEASCLLIIP